MIAYHGATDRRARRIFEEGFLPRKPSRRVWFAEGRGYALRRAKVQARRAPDRAVVLTCNIDIHHLRERLGSKRVLRRNGVIAVNGRVPVSALRSHPASEQPSSSEELAAWVNRLLGVKPCKGVGQRHPGIERLSRWAANRLASEPRGKINPKELLQMARQWLPELFEGVEIDIERLQAYRKVKTIEVETALAEADAREDEALECLASPNPKRRRRGLSLLAEIEDPYLFEWCVMYVDDESRDVRVAALHTMLRCSEGDPEVIVPLAGSEDKRIRGAAVAALAKHSGEDSSHWLERGLKDPSPCVRVETVALLSQLDPVEHQPLFVLVLYDPNPEIARLARKLTEGKGYAKVMW